MEDLSAATPVVLDGGPLPLAAVAAVARGRARVALSADARARLGAARAFVDRLADADEPIYGITTGVGKLKDVVIPVAERDRLQRNLVLSHAGGVGAPLAEDETRAVMLLLAASLARGASGVRPLVADTLVACLNRGVHPVVPELGSVGSSGDLAPLAHVAACLIGEGEAWRDARPVPAREALAAAGIAPVALATKEGLALLNGTHLMAGLGALAVLDVTALVRLADVTGAMSLEALMGSNAAFEERVHRLRPHPGQLATAGNLRRLTDASAIIASHADCTRVQDAYSLRCMPQVHGSAREALGFARSILERELASVTDNPLVFPDDGVVRSGGNFHGEIVGLALDTLAVGLASLAGITERRIDRLVNPLTSEGLPPFLASDRGLNSGYMIAQYVAAALVSELRLLAHPASVDSIPTSGLQEDYNAMAAASALKLRRAVGLARQVLAIELLLAAQALDFRAPLAPGRGSAAARDAVRARIPALAADRYLKADLDAALALAADGSVIEAVERAIGPLA
ncbi:MAG: histidine ammonia-lyase [Candidatus Rokubacteria bacterium]|nr:histidine ammonia-lyase [Candidatus Rokubacteria bacterium]